MKKMKCCKCGSIFGLFKLNKNVQLSLNEADTIKFSSILINYYTEQDIYTRIKGLNARIDEMKGTKEVNEMWLNEIKSEKDITINDKINNMVLKVPT